MAANIRDENQLILQTELTRNGLPSRIDFNPTQVPTEPMRRQTSAPVRGATYTPSLHRFSDLIQALRMPLESHVDQTTFERVSRFLS
jgi:hypothetical protein